MDFNAAMETFAEAWVAANTQTAINSDSQTVKQSSFADLPTLISKEKLIESKGNDSKESSTESPQKGCPITSPGSSNGTKSLPIHCIVEQITGAPDFKCCVANPANIELDGYAILPGSTPLSELIRSALLKLGYSNADSIGANGAIQLKNWKPLSFDTITDNADTPVDDILGELTQVATLRIKLCRSAEDNESATWTDKMVRNAVLSLLKEMSQVTLAKSSPICQSMISNIVNGKYSNRLSSEKCKEFGDWYYKYKTKSADFQKNTEGKTSRLTFHPVFEVPILREYYKSIKTPSHKNLQDIVNELNSGHVRQDRPKVTVRRLKIWWKNERQREKRLQRNETNKTMLNAINVDDDSFGAKMGGECSYGGGKGTEKMDLLESPPAPLYPNFTND